MSRRAPHNRDSDWHALFRRASIDMRPWGCTPGTYLIDNLLDPLRRDRHWLVDHLAYLAQVTRERGPDVEQDDITLRWNVWMIAPGGIRVRVRILVDRRDDRIFNAFPDRYR